MTLIEVGDEAVLSEEVEVVGLGDLFKVGQFGLEFGVPVVVVVEHSRVEVLAEQRAAGGCDLPGLIGLDGEDVAGLLVSVDCFHFFVGGGFYLPYNISTCHFDDS